MAEVELARSPGPARTSGSRRSSRSRTGPRPSAPAPCPMTLRALPATASNFAGCPARKNAASPSPNPSCVPDRLRPLRPERLGDRPRRLHAAFAPEDVAHPRQPLALRVGVHPVAERPAAAPGAGIARTSLPACSSRPAKTLKPEPRKCSETTCISIGLRRSGLSVPYQTHRVAIGDARELRRHRPPAAEAPRRRRASPARSPRKHRPAWRSSSPCRAGRTRRASGPPAGPRRGSRARSGSSGRTPPP